jgi:hypothetical protein
MRRRLAWSLSAPVLLFVLVPGCQVLSRSRPVAILARDAETKQPIARAEVVLSYPTSSVPMTPGDSSGVTGADGVVHLQATPTGPGARVEVSASGYLSANSYLTADAVQALAPAGFFEKVETRPPSLTVDLYSGPSPTVELILPMAFRGLVQADLQIQENAPCPPGQRCFRYEVPSSGEVAVVGPPLLRRVFAVDFRAGYADGTPLNRQAKDNEIGFWYLKTEGTVQFFLVGTQAERDAWRRSAPRDGGGEGRSGGNGGGGGKGGGRGGRRNRGGGGGDAPPS